MKALRMGYKDTTFVSVHDPLAGNHIVVEDIVRSYSGAVFD